MSAPVLLHELLGLDAAPSDVAVVDEQAEHSYGRLRERVDELARALRHAGVQRGDRVAILLPKSFDECAAVFAASRADAAFVPINPVLKTRQIEHILVDSGARALITCPALRARHESAVSFPDDLRLVDVEDPAPGPAQPLPPSVSIGQDLAAILYTSGSTGAPKGVMLSHANLLAGTRIVRTYLGITFSDRILSALPFSFDYGLNQLLTSVEQGATLVICAFQIGDQIVRQLASHRITGLAGVPTIWAMLTRTAPSLRNTPLPHLRYITNSGGALPEATVSRLRSLLPETRIFLMYGLTEAFRSTFLPPEEIDRRPTSIGKAIPECEVFPVREDGSRARPGEPGILVHRGPTVSLGYWRRPEDSARVLRPNPLRRPDEGPDVVCYSGDLVVEDDEGFLYFVARQDAMIKSSGYRISPTEVEESLMRTGLFRQAAVIGVPDEWIGQRLCAVVVPSDDATPIDRSEVLRALSKELPSYMVPGRIDVVGTLPVTPNGKVDYNALLAERSA